MTQHINSIDLFAGCGGISLGFERAGIKVLAAIDTDPKAVEVYRSNFPDVPHVLREDLTCYSPEDLAERIGSRCVDIVAGGPPCQGYSNVRQVDGANHGDRLVSDHRRTLYRHFLRFVDYFQPKVFVMENVLGIRSAEGGIHLEGLLSLAESLSYVPLTGVVNAADYGIPQSRRRLLVVGIREDMLVRIPQDFEVAELMGPKSETPTSLWEAIGDLPALEAGQGADPMPYDADRLLMIRDRFQRSDYLDSMLKGSDECPLTAHIARPHNARDLRDFDRLRPGENSKQAIARGETMEFPYNRDVFQDKYNKLDPHKPSRTVLAHMSRDGLMYIHPEQNRSLTPREAARLQSFPDSFHFRVPRTHQYRLIGNAVPPMLAERLARGIIKLLM